LDIEEFEEFLKLGTSLFIEKAHAPLGISVGAPLEGLPARA
jgi:hypothetical protein